MVVFVFFANGEPKVFRACIFLVLAKPLKTKIYQHMAKKIIGWGKITSWQES